MRRNWVPQYDGVPTNISPLLPNTRGNKGQPVDAGHIHHFPVGLDSKTSAVDITNTATETVLLTTTLDGSLLQAGTAFLSNIYGIWSKTNNGTTTGTFRWRIGTTSLTGTIVHSLVVTATASSSGSFQHISQLDLFTVGGTGTATAGQLFITDASTTYSTAYFGGASSATTTVDTTSTSLIIELTFQWTSADTNFHITPSLGTLRFLRTL